MGLDITERGVRLGLARVASDKLQGNQSAVLLDLLGDRIAAERTGIRLYHALLVKLEK